MGPENARAILTRLGALSNIDAMNTELSRLEAQLEQLVDHFQAGKRDRGELCARIAALEADNRKLNEKLAVAVSRLESMLERLPEN